MGHIKMESAGRCFFTFKYNIYTYNQLLYSCMRAQPGDHLAWFQSVEGTAYAIIVIIWVVSKVQD